MNIINKVVEAASAGFRSSAPQFLGLDGGNISSTWLHLILSVVTHLEATHECVYFFLFLDDYNDMEASINKGTRNKFSCLTIPCMKIHTSSSSPSSGCEALMNRAPRLMEKAPDLFSSSLLQCTYSDEIRSLVYCFR